VPLLREALGDSDFEAMQRDPVRFVRAFDRSPWGYQAETLRKILAKRNDGKFIHRIAVVSWPRQDGKSTVSAWAGLVRLFCAEQHQTIITVALDRDSARIILNDARRIIQESPILFDLVDESWGLTKSSIRLKDSREWFIKSADGRFSRGQRPTTVLFDELGWSTDDGELFQVLSAGMGAAVNPLMIITSTVGPIQAGPLWDLFERKDDSDILLLYTNENQSPLVTEEFLAGQRSILPPTIYSREHENKWGSGSDVFCTMDDYKRATADYDPILPRDDGPTFAFVDLGWSHDETSIAIAKNVEGKTDIIYLVGMRGTSEKPLSLPQVEELLEHLVEKFGIREVEIESPQGLSMAQSLSLKGVQANVLHPTVKSNAERWGALYSGLKNGKLRLPPKDELLRRQLVTLTIKESFTGWRVEDLPAYHNDRAVAVAGAYYLAETKRHPSVLLMWTDGSGIMSDGTPIKPKYESELQAQDRLLREAINRDFD
jgi:hypothetical protein